MYLLKTSVETTGSSCRSTRSCRSFSSVGGGWLIPSPRQDSFAHAFIVSHPFLRYGTPEVRRTRPTRGGEVGGDGSRCLYLSSGMDKRRRPRSSPVREEKNRARRTRAGGDEEMGKDTARGRVSSCEGKHDDTV